MAKPPRLKVFRTAIGFHDAYVAAPSQKAALKAWGSDHNLFASGAAEVVTDAALAKAPLDNPGKVLKVLRGTHAEQLAALGDAEPPKDGGKVATTEVVAIRARRGPRPSRSGLDDAEATIEEVRTRHRAEEAALRLREAELRHERERFEERQASEDAAAEKRRAREEAAYDRAVRKWRED